MTFSIAGPWHEVTVSVDTFINAEGDERPGWVFDGPHCDESCDNPGDCFLLTTMWPPEAHEMPGGPGRYLVKWVTAGFAEQLEWVER